MLSTLGLVVALSSLRTHGTALPAATLPSLRGPSVALRSLIGRPSVVVIFADWCDPCHADMPSILASAKRNPSVRFLGIDALESAFHARAFVAATRVPFATLLLTNVAFSKPGVTDEQRGATGLDIPAVYVLDRRGIVVEALVGGDPHVGAKIDAALRALSANAAGREQFFGRHRAGPPTYS